MPKPPKQFDVWFLTANTVYKAVPYQVVADWVQQGRLGAGDMVRPAGTEVAWTRVDGYDVLADYLPRTAAGWTAAPSPTVLAAPLPAAATPDAPPAEPADVDLDPLPRRRRGEEDDDVDMIPLIDISIVLLVFFILISSTSSRPSVAVPDTTFSGQATADPEAVVIAIQPAQGGAVQYAVRVGEQPADPENGGLSSAEMALSRLDAVLKARKNPPRVRIACHKDLPSEKVFQFYPRLRELKEQREIVEFQAEVQKAR